jgi:hypothetical protein
MTDTGHFDSLDVTLRVIVDQYVDGYRLAVVVFLTTRHMTRHDMMWHDMST